MKTNGYISIKPCLAFLGQLITKIRWVVALTAVLLTGLGAVEPAIAQYCHHQLRPISGRRRHQGLRLQEPLV